MKTFHPSQPYRIEQFLINAAKRFPDKVGLECDDISLTYKQIDIYTDHLSNCLVENGFHTGDRALIYLDNSSDSVLALFSVLKAGGVFSVINTRIKPRKLNYIINDSGAVAIFIHSRFHKVFSESLNDISTLKFAIWIKNFPDEFNDYHHRSLLHVDFEDAINNSGQNIIKINPNTFSPSDIATIVYTSGSTGKPKGVVCPHSNVIAAVDSIIDYLFMKSDDITIDLMPLAFDYGLYQVFMTFRVGGKVILHRGYDYPQRILNIICREKITGLPLVPTLATTLIERCGNKPLKGHCLRYITNTAAALTTRNIRGLQHLFPDVAIYSMYGLTECKRVSYLPPELIDKKPNSVGIPMKNVKVWVADDNGEPLPPGEVGELMVQGPNVMRGYWNDIEATKKVFVKNHHSKSTTLCSGDFFKIDADGFLYFISRKDDMVKFRGERFYPSEIEDVLSEIDIVRDSLVMAVSDNNKIVLKAYISTNTSSIVAKESVLNYCRQHIESYFIPHDIIFLNQLPKLPNGKIDKNALREMGSISHGTSAE